MFGSPNDQPGSVWVKICGICSARDARAAVDFGADAIGLNSFRGSRRFLDIVSAADWIAALPDALGKIAVMVNPTFDEAMSVARLPFISGLQLHGNESPEFCRALADEGVRFAKALPVADEDSLADLPSFSSGVVVLDSAKTVLFGGSGTPFPWPLAQSFVQSHSHLKVILAGGLTPQNVVEAITAVRPFGVDVTSGVEASLGRKDHGRLRAFIEAARSAH